MAWLHVYTSVFERSAVYRPWFLNWLCCAVSQHKTPVWR